MKYSRITASSKLPLRLSFLDAEQFNQRIQRDTSDLVINYFRNDLPHLDKVTGFRLYEKMLRICPAVELKRQPNGAVVFGRFNGLVVLDVKGVVGTAAQEQLKTRAMSLPFTQAAFVGASGQSVKLLVRVARADGSVPQTETEAETFYRTAHRELVPLYNALIAPCTVVPETPGLCHAFLMPLDTAPRLNLDTAHYTPVGSQAAGTDAAEATPSSPGDSLSSVPPPLHEQRSSDWERFEVYERTYGECARKARELTGIPPTDAMNTVYLTELARQLCLAGLPQEEAFEHIWHHLMFKRDADGEAVRAIVEATYDEEIDDHHSILATPGDVSSSMRRLIRKLEQRYVFRYNTIMGYAEMRRNITAFSPWTPVTQREIADLTIEARMAEIPVWDNDVRRFIESSRVRDYSIISDYLFDCPHWDGHDHIRALARTVPTDTPQWPDWFHTWFLGMVAQWQRRNIRFGNAIVPLLISRQGYHKSDFCRSLLPRELRSWGFTDTLSLAEERPVLLAMTQMLLISLDEFNQISPRKQEGFLKNIIQLPTVKVKRPYARHIEDIPRLASFIATTNQHDVLSDPSGSRRFVGIYVQRDIDTSQTPNHRQLFAQAMAELDDGARYWFDADEMAAIMEHNLRFQQHSDAMAFFLEYFDLPSEPSEGQWMTSAAILAEVKRRAQAALRTPPTVNKFARELRALRGVQVRTSHSSDVYLVRMKDEK